MIYGGAAGRSPLCGTPVHLESGHHTGGPSAGVSPALSFIDLGLLLYPLPVEGGGKGEERREKRSGEGQASTFSFSPFLKLTPCGHRGAR